MQHILLKTTFTGCLKPPAKLVFHVNFTKSRWRDCIKGPPLLLLPMGGAVGKGLLKENPKKKKAGQTGKLFEWSLDGFQAQKGNCATFFAIYYAWISLYIFPILFHTVFGGFEKTAAPALDAPIQNARSRYHIRFGDLPGCFAHPKHWNRAPGSYFWYTHGTVPAAPPLALAHPPAAWRDYRSLCQPHGPGMPASIAVRLALETNQPTNQPLKKVHCSEGLFLVAGLLKGSGWVVF